MVLKQRWFTKRRKRKSNKKKQRYYRFTASYKSTRPKVSKRTKIKTYLSPKNLTIIISVPHANPNGSGDMGSKEQSQWLFKELYNLNYDVHYYINEDVRIVDKSDYNRFISPWPELTNELIRIGTLRKPCIHLDVHAFGDKPPEKWNVDPSATFVFMSEGKSYKILKSMKHIYGFDLVQGSQDNRNIVISRRNNIPSLIIEYQSSARYRPDVMNQVISLVFEFSKRYIHKHGLPKPLLYI